MADPPLDPDTHSSSDDGPDRGSTTGPPRWVKVFGIIAVVLVALIVISLLTGHGPGRHMTGGLGAPTPATTAGSRSSSGVSDLLPLAGGRAS